jgi:hypothetical protein
MRRFLYFHTLRRVWPFLAAGTLCLLIILPIAAIDVITGYRPPSGVEWSTVLTNALPFFLLIAFWCAAILVLPYFNARRQFSDRPNLAESVTYTFTSDEFSSVGPDASWSLAWRNFKFARETNSLFLLYHGKNIAVIVPKHFFENAWQIDQWRGLVWTRLAPGKVKKTGIIGHWF